MFEIAFFPIPGLRIALDAHLALIGCSSGCYTCSYPPWRTKRPGYTIRRATSLTSIPHSAPTKSRKYGIPSVYTTPAYRSTFLKRQSSQLQFSLLAYSASTSMRYFIPPITLRHAKSGSQPTRQSGTALLSMPRFDSDVTAACCTLP